MATFPDEVFDEMYERVQHIDTFIADPTEFPEGNRVGSILRCGDAGFMAVEFGQAPDGSAFVSVRRFDRFGESVPVSITDVENSVMIVG